MGVVVGFLGGRSRGGGGRGQGAITWALEEQMLAEVGAGLGCRTIRVVTVPAAT